MPTAGDKQVCGKIREMSVWSFDVDSILEGELAVKEEPDTILNKEKVFRSSFRSSLLGKQIPC